jgi:hypothetical protein
VEEEGGKTLILALGAEVMDNILETTDVAR